MMIGFCSRWIMPISLQRKSDYWYENWAELSALKIQMLEDGREIPV